MKSYLTWLTKEMQIRVNLFFHLSTCQRFKSLIITGMWVHEEMGIVYWWAWNGYRFPGGQFHNMNQES